jgi:hypothetical protein
VGRSGGIGRRAYREEIIKKTDDGDVKFKDVIAVNRERGHVNGMSCANRHGHGLENIG